MNILGHRSLLFGQAKRYGPAPVFESVGTMSEASAYASSITVNYPALVNQNDILFLVMLRKDNSVYNFYGAQNPTGWTVVHDFCTYPAVRLWWKRAGGSESGAINVPVDAADNLTYAYIFRVSGCTAAESPFASLPELTYGGPTHDLYVDMGKVPERNCLSLLLFFAYDTTSLYIESTSDYDVAYNNITPYPTMFLEQPSAKVAEHTVNCSLSKSVMASCLSFYLRPPEL